MLTLALPLLAYLFGSLSGAVIVCRVMGLPDPRASGSNNPGATNVLRIGGRKAKKAALITLVGDVLKGAVAVLAVGALSDDSVVIALAGAGAFLGHLYPVFFGFKGGKGVATAAGVFTALSAASGGLLVLVWLATALVFRYSSLAALLAAAAAPVLTLWLLPQPGYFAMSLSIAALLFWRHRGNIRRLGAGTESKISFTAGG